MTDLQAILDAGGPWQQARIIGDQLLIQGDCLDVMAVLPKVCAVVTDPPYGINYSGQAQSVKRNGAKGLWRIHHEEKGWDKQTPSQDVFKEILEGSDAAIIWGGNYFADALPATRGWLVWYKAQTGLSMSDAELAWSNIDMVCRLNNLHRGALWREGPQHPTQKPIALMEWCLGFLPDARTILDPFAGSFTTAVACQRLGRQSISIELDADYYAIGCKRVQEVVNNPPLFKPDIPKPKQEVLEL